MTKLDEHKELLKVQKEILVGYLKSKVREEDWHGVADAAMDLRDTECELAGIEFAEKHLVT